VLPGGRSLFGITFVHSMTEFSAWITVLVVAFDHGGASETGLAVAVQLVPAALLAPVVAAAGDRFARHLVLSVGFAILAMTAGGMAVALVSDLGRAAVYACAAVFSVALGSTPGAVASLLVRHARSPVELVRWNIGQSFMRAGGTLVGPVVTAVLLAVTQPSVVFAAIACVCAATAIVVQARLPNDDRPRSTVRLRSILADSVEGVRYIAVTRNPRRVVGFIGVTGLLLGAFDVIFVAVAFDQLDGGGSTSAALTAAFAAGALVAAMIASRRLGWKLTSLATIGALLLSIPLTVLGEFDRLAPALAMVALLGAGNALIEITVHTLLQRTCNETMTSRAFGVRDSILLIATAIGAGVIGLVISANDLTTVLVVVGSVAAIVLVGLSVGLRRTERDSAVTADADMLDALRGVSFLEPLPLPTLERLASGAERREVPGGECLIAEGEHGVEFFVLLEGAAEISVGGRIAGCVDAPASFGEVALLHDSIRTATVTTTRRSRLAVIQRGPFLDAIRTTTTSHEIALDVTRRYRPQT
jgi:MFS family permease